MHASLSAWFLASILSTATPTSTTPYASDGFGLGVSTAALATLTIVAQGIMPSSLRPPLNCPTDPSGGFCDPGSLPAFDRGAVGRSSHAWVWASDVGVGLAFAAPWVLAAVSRFGVKDNPASFRDIGIDLLVVGQAILVANLASYTLKFAVGRPRPGQYAEDTVLRTSRRQSSFPSGHVTVAAAAVAATTTTLFLRWPKARWKYGALAAGVAVVAMVAAGRVLGGAHFPTDVVAGVAIGGAIGTLLPWWQRKIVAQDHPLAAGKLALGVSSRMATMSLRF